MRKMATIMALVAAGALAGCATDNVAWHDANHLNYENPPQGIYTTRANAPHLQSQMPEPGNYDVNGPVAEDHGIAPGKLFPVGAVVTMAPGDLQFMRNQMSEGQFVVNAGEEALRKSSNAHVQAVARQTISDRQTLNRQLSDLAQAKGLSVSKRATAEHEKMLAGLKAATGADFDQLYISQLAHVSNDALAELQNEATYGQDPDVRNWANATTPFVQGNVAMITTPGMTTPNYATER